MQLTLMVYSTSKKLFNDDMRLKTFTHQRIRQVYRFRNDNDTFNRQYFWKQIAFINEIGDENA